jgi:transposase InsO family protein
VLLPAEVGPARQAMAPRQAEAGTPVGEICRKLGVSEQTFYRWKKRFGALGMCSCGGRGGEWSIACTPRRDWRWFLNLEGLQRTLTTWRDDYNHHRPHSSLADIPPAELPAGGAFSSDGSRLQLARASGPPSGRTAAPKAESPEPGQTPGPT